MKELREALKQKNKVIIGTEKTLKLLKKGQLTIVYMSSNCPNHVKQDVEHYAKLHEIKIIKLNESNEELGVICKKPFSISILGF